MNLLDDEFYHAIDPDDWLFGHNIRIYEGRVVAQSLRRSTSVPYAEDMLSPYEAFMAEREKEEVFERVRAEEFPDHPPRLGSIFLFPDRETAETANARWWGGRRVVLPARVTTARRAAIYDSMKLDARREDWENAARQYWGGLQTQDPHLELVVEGVIQLSGWEPYARFGPPT